MSPSGGANETQRRVKLDEFEGRNRSNPWAPATLASFPSVIAAFGRGTLKMPDRVIFRETPESAELQGVLYLARSQRLWVYFRNGAVHVYFDVDTATWEAFQSAESKEKFVLGLPSYEALVLKKKV